MSSERAHDRSACSPSEGLALDRLVLSPEHTKLVGEILRQHVPDLQVRVFGSRAAGKPKPFSDLDLLLMSRQPVGVRCLALLAEAFSESDLPFKVDLLDWSATEPSFRERLLPGSIIVQREKAA
jgi:uncharacterized protein